MQVGNITPGMILRDVLELPQKIVEEKGDLNKKLMQVSVVENLSEEKGKSIDIEA